MEICRASKPDLERQIEALSVLLGGAHAPPVAQAMETPRKKQATGCRTKVDAIAEKLLGEEQ